MWAARTQERVRANGRQDGIGKTRKWRRACEPAFRFGSDLTNTIRARGQRGLHQEAGHTTVPDQAATDSVLKPDLSTRGRPHTPFDAVFSPFKHGSIR